MKEIKNGTITVFPKWFPCSVFVKKYGETEVAIQVPARSFLMEVKRFVCAYHGEAEWKTEGFRVCTQSELRDMKERDFCSKDILINSGYISDFEEEEEETISLPWYKRLFRRNNDIPEAKLLK